MPEISRFYGISILLYVRNHPPPHSHAEYQEQQAVSDFDTLRLKEGRWSARAQSPGVEWAALHREDLESAWLALQAGRTPGKIARLE